MRTYPTAEERFWSKVDKNGPVPIHRPELGPCWIWKAALSTQGYGRFGVRVGLIVYSHHFTFGPVKEGNERDHLCRVRSCVRPSHMEEVTHQVNILRGESPCAKESKQTTCKMGHTFTTQNTYYRKDRFQRSCRKCRKAAMVRFHARSSSSKQVQENLP